MKALSALAHVAAAAFLAVAALGAQAGTPALSYSLDTGTTLGNGPFTLGWSFTVNQTITVDSLGVFDDSGDGLSESHEVGIWNSSGTLLTFATVAAGTVDPLTANFRYASIAPITLTPGTYTIGAVWIDGADNMIFPGAGGTVTTSPDITILGNAYIAGGTLTDPTNSTGDLASYFGPDFTLNAVAAPEPAMWTVLLVGLGAIGASMRMVRRNRGREIVA